MDQIISPDSHPWRKSSPPTTGNHLLKSIIVCSLNISETYIRLYNVYVTQILLITRVYYFLGVSILLSPTVTYNSNNNRNATLRYNNDDNRWMVIVFDPRIPTAQCTSQKPLVVVIYIYIYISPTVIFLLFENAIT